MKPIDVAEQLMFTTVRISANKSCGTGYFFTYTINGHSVPIIVTNKHVVNNNPDEEVTFFLHLTEDGENAVDNINVKIKTHWNFHPTHDLCFTYIAELFPIVEQRTGKKVFFKAIKSSLIYNKEKLKELSMIENVVMIGYPNGLWDQTNNFPVFRYGYTAAHPGYDFNRPDIGLVDIACFPGSSGSPIFILNEGSYRDKHNNISLGGNRVIFLGTLFAGPTIMADGTINEIEIPTGTQAYSRTQLMMNLGYYIKAHEMECFKEMIESDLKHERII